ncbi:MAG: DUF523 and DUF1722 domain-containing protein [Spirochaetia bacterium]|jgi:uncharacterized protein YbgA (DUF1722 family)/uncharacterized protein YbbK (DUF523 family)|nr:DUF523 and DUF1722 domain-containing protein [Spirochaetia bacterium]
MEKIKLGVSACLLGQEVRYDGGHKHDRYITDTLGPFFDFIPVCPEVECGLPIPREAMRLVGDPAAPRLVTNKTGIDHTQRMLAYAQGRVEALAGKELCGFIFKKDSPSSGLHRVKVYGEGGIPGKSGRGLFAAAFTARFPLVPVEEEGRLNDPELRENFIERVFAYNRLKALLAGCTGSRSKGLGALVEFHTAHKLQLMAHSVPLYRDLGVLVAQAKGKDLTGLLQSYEELFMKALSFMATVKKNCNVLSHSMGYFKKDLSADEKAELVEIIDQYRNGFVPLIVPITIIRHYVRKYGESYLEGQLYFRPHPAELMLRNHV